MTESARDLGVEDLEARYRASKDVVERTHCQVIFLLAQGHTRGAVAQMTALTPRWVNAIARRYREHAAAALGDGRHDNAGARPLLSDDDLAALRARLADPPDDGGLWSGPKVARWIAGRLGLAHVHAPRGWEALKKIGWSVQAPRPRIPKAATPEQEAAFKKSSPKRSKTRRARIPIGPSRFGPATNTGSA